jgi:ABC-type amino acid transport substrate-binding protein
MEIMRMPLPKSFAAALSLLSFCVTTAAHADDLAEIKDRGVLRHLGVPYANFVTGGGDGFDVELVQLFADHLGVEYEYVKTDWAHVIPDLIGREVTPQGAEVEFGGAVPVRGDMIANGLTILDWRSKAVSFSAPLFPTQVWLLAPVQSPVQPIKPTGDVDEDIRTTKECIRGHSVLTIQKTCLDPSLHNLQETGGEIRCFAGQLNELAPALIKGEADLTILDVPDVMVALQKWPGQIKAIGPISAPQEMGCAFAPDAPALRQAFDEFMKQCLTDGTYERLVEKYYPGIQRHFPEFFVGKTRKAEIGVSAATSAE